MLAYVAFCQIEVEQNDVKIINLSHKLIKSVKTYKQHWTVDNLDVKWIKWLDMQQQDVDLLQDVVKKMRNC